MTQKEKAAPSFDATSENRFSTDSNNTATKLNNFSETAKDSQEKDADVEAFNAEAENMQPRWRQFVHDFGNREIARPDFLLQIGGVPMMPRHELTTITGKAGQGKTYFNTILLGALLRGDPVLDIIPLRPVGRILFIDTEQSEFDVAERSNAMFRAMGWQEFTAIPQDRLTYLRLRTAEDNATRKAVTEEAIGDLHPEVIFLDGLTDLIVDIENKNEAHDTVAWWLSLSDKSDCNIISTIHQNEGSESTKLREFVGSESARKSRSIIDVSVKDGHFTAKALKGRPFSYDWRLDPFGNLTTTLAPAQIAGEQEKKALYDLFSKVIGKRNKFDSRRQIYCSIGSVSGKLSESLNKETYERAQIMDVVSEKYNGHKYCLSLQENGYNDK